MGDAVSQTVARPPTTSSLQKSRTQRIWSPSCSHAAGSAFHVDPAASAPLASHRCCHVTPGCSPSHASASRRPGPQVSRFVLACPAHLGVRVCRTSWMPISVTGHEEGTTRAENLISEVTWAVPELDATQVFSMLLAFSMVVFTRWTCRRGSRGSRVGNRVQRPARPVVQPCWSPRRDGRANAGSRLLSARGDTAGSWSAGRGPGQLARRRAAALDPRLSDRPPYAVG